MATINGTSNSENITGTSSSDIIYANNGNDMINGGKGADKMYGGLGNDIYYVDSYYDTIYENTAEGTDIVRSYITYTLGINVENLELQGTSAINGFGNDYNNKLTGNAAANTLKGGLGNDILNGLGGADKMYGGLGDDVYYIDVLTDGIYENANEGTDTVYSKISYTLGSNLENLTLYSTVNINAVGNAYDNTLIGNAGNNILNGLAGADYMAGGLGNDTYYIDNKDDNVVENPGAGTDKVFSAFSYTLDDNIENLTLTGTTAITAVGNSLNNVIAGNSLDNVLEGGDGNDVLNGGVGNDTMIGGLGDDLYYIDSADDVVIENENEGTDSIITSFSCTLGDNFENLYLNGTTAIYAVGNDYNNGIYGNSASNIIDGGLGRDYMAGGAGNDIYYVDDVADLAYENANAGTDTVYSTVSYSLGSNLERLYLQGSGNINATGNNLNNVLKGTSGDNILNGGSGADSMYGGLGNDTYYIDNSGDKIYENADEGIDTVRSSLSYTISTNFENLTLIGSSSISGTGNAYDNTIIGNNGNNILKGGAGDDVISGGAGNDTMYGGADDDIYYVDSLKDVVIEYANQGTDTVSSLYSYTLSSNVENLTLTGTSNAILTTVASTQAVAFGESNYWKNYLDYYQTDNSYGYRGDCGIVSCENILIQAGVFSKKSGYSPSYGVIDSLETQIVGKAITNSYCVTSGTSNQKGGTTFYDQEDILESYGVQATAQYTTLETVAAAIKQNKGVIVEINAYKIWGSSYSSTVNHAITVTGVVYNAASPNTILGFYICDSGRLLKTDAQRYISYATMKSAFYYSYGYTKGMAVITDEPIKEMLGTINGTGNDLSNTITGSSVANILSGLGGDDTLIGNEGNDQMIGGAGSDTFIVNAEDGSDVISDESGTSDALIFGEDISKSDIVFYASDDDVIFDYLGGNQVVLQNQLSSNDAIEKVQLSDNSYLTDSLINNLIAQMTSYCSSNGIEITSADDVRSNEYLNNLVVNSWTAA